MHNSVLYSWTSYLSVNDQYWYLDSISLNFIFYDAILSLLPFLMLFNFFFYSVYISNDYSVLFSIFDFIQILKFNNLNSLSNVFYLDLFYNTSNNFSFFLEIFQVNNQNTLSLTLLKAPEVVLILTNFLSSTFISSTVSLSESVTYSAYIDNLMFANLELFFFLNLYFFFTLIVILFVNLFSTSKWYLFNSTFMNRLYYYFYTVAVEFRLQFDMTLQLVFFFFFYWVVMLIIFDTDKEEFIESFNLSLFYFFLSIILFFLIKYSYHYFSFLEASVVEGRSVLFISKQFVRDVSNTLALFLRFFLLLFRLNIYDSLDDFYDSYYIFVGDFDEDDYLTENVLPLISNLMYTQDNNSDKVFMLEEEHVFFLDFFYIYFLIWGKLFFFLFLLVEEVLRVSLAIYIIYLIVLDVHAVNASYTEDLYLIKKRLV